MYILGVDGGGTKCKVGLFDEQGKLYSSKTTGPANIYTDLKLALHSIEDACQQIFTEVATRHGLTLNQQDCILSAGCAGASIDHAASQFLTQTHHFKRVFLHTDIHISCVSANSAKDCALLICGTGSCIAKFEHKLIQQFGGHGFLLGDIGSGAWIGRNAVSWYLRSLDENKPSKDVLFECLESHLGRKANDIVKQFGSASANEFASLVPIICSSKSSLVDAWLQQGIDYFAKLIEGNMSSKLPVFIDGGMSELYQNTLAMRLNREVARPQQEAIFGAFAIAKSAV
ncbi:BadF/BadG/BcrA/BcrD ATPase family protein [Glaciecola petra]|uniref:BadF/BadG/BcrA/BcrD ATPase family protein n=1 Tax=Glaciecola petra TaxID=3075602 RepID=A0ABU2ZRU3_9ALTE|nr:BadF/BadG/BcrA/BcrD ATPase family protein [Aestuariibacter sp. P117]MDT0595352.1 BadF/BadG/BcrA/BcrD ATPase family protein [Aestuariibacter sp. P117]